MKIEVADGVKERFPGHGIAAWAIRLNDVDILKRKAGAMEAEFLETKDYAVLEHEIVQWQSVFARMGAKSKHKPSIDFLYGRFRKSGNVFKIGNVFVDFYNMLSLITATPMGAYKLSAISEPLSLVDTLAPDLRFTPMGRPSNRESVQPGEVYYRDSNRVLCRMWNMGDCEETKVTSLDDDLLLIADMRDQESRGDLLVKKVTNEIEAIGTIISSFHDRW